MFAATTSNAVGSVFSGIPVHPGEDASANAAKEEDDWCTTKYLHEKSTGFITSSGGDSKY